MSERRGCLLFGLPRALTRGRAKAALSSGPALPRLDPAKIDRGDLPTLVKARKAASGCLQVLYDGRQAVGDAVLQDVGGRVVSLLRVIFDIGERLAEGRRFLAANSVDAIAREKADVEMQLLGASVREIAELKKAMIALDERRRFASSSEAEVERLAARLVAAAAELQALRARLQSALGSDELVHELRAYQRSAELALEAYERTATEMGAL